MARLSDEEEASSSSDSETGSDSSSVHTIWDNPPQRARVVAEEANGYSAEYFIRGGGSHFSGKLVDNRAKRKLRSNGNDGSRASKTLRLDSYHVPLTVEDLDVLDRQDSDYDNDKEEEEDDEEEHAGRDVELGFLAPEFRLMRSHRARPAVRQQQGDAKLGPKQSLPSTDKMTAYDLMRQQLPSLALRKEDVQEKFRFLTDLPVKRVPILTGDFNTNKPQNTISYLIQASGELLPDTEACESCLSSRGIYQGCVVTKDPIINESLQGACARCWYNRRGFQCSLRQIYEPESQSDTPESIPERCPPLPPPPPSKQMQLEPMAEQTPEPLAVSRFQQNLRPSSGLKVHRKSTPVSALYIGQKPTPVPIPQPPSKSTPIPVPQAQQKSTPIPVPQVQQTWKPASGAQVQETPKPAPVSKVQETWKPLTVSPVPIPVPPAMRRSTSGENQKSTPIPTQNGSGSGGGGGGNGAVRKETPVLPPKYTPIRPPPPPGSIFIPSSHPDFPIQRASGGTGEPPASSSDSSEKNSDQFTGLSVGLPSFSTQMQLSRKERVDGWTKRYEKMPFHELQATQKHLAEWNTECGVRIEALMSVLMKKFTKPQATSDGA